MLSKEMEDAINNQINNEYFASYIYLSMSAYCESINMKGFASWLRGQSHEELQHALKLFDHLIDRDGRVILQSISKPQSRYSSLLKMFQQALEHEKEVTSLINKLYEQATNEGDHATTVELQWFIQEQVEEEKNAREIVDKLKLAGDSSSALIILDREMANSSSQAPE